MPNIFVEGHFILNLLPEHTRTGPTDRSEPLQQSLNTIVMG